MEHPLKSFPLPEVITIAEAGRRLGVSHTAIAHRLASGTLEEIKLPNGRRYVDASSLKPGKPGRPKLTT